MNLTKTLRKVPISLDLARLGASSEDVKKEGPKYDEAGSIVRPPVLCSSFQRSPPFPRVCRKSTRLSLHSHCHEAPSKLLSPDILSVRVALFHVGPAFCCAACCIGNAAAAAAAAALSPHGTAPRVYSHVAVSSGTSAAAPRTPPSTSRFATARGACRCRLPHTHLDVSFHCPQYQPTSADCRH
jgi:hypothetical protein